MNKSLKSPVFMRRSSKQIEALDSDWAALEDLISGRRRFAPEIEKWISDEIRKTGKTRKQILKESVGFFKKNQRINLVKKARKDFAKIASDLAENIRAPHAKPPR